jgi:predicted PurR-regulated permease PerM
MACALVLILRYHLLPGLLAVCLGFLGARWLGMRLGGFMHSGAAANLAAAAIVLMPLLLVAAAFPYTRGVVLDAPAQYRELLAFMARTVLELRERLPPDIASQLPEGAAEIQRVLAAYLGSKAGSLAITGRAWLAGLVHVVVGLIIGALAATRPPTLALKPLSAQLHIRVRRFGETFRQIVVAQFWIALFNTGLLTLFLFLVLPLWGYRLPYAMVLILLSFVLGLIPIVGNLLYNTVLTLVGLSVSAVVALACLVFLILIHKAEYFINAKVVGQRTQLTVWELLATMFVLEAIFGPAGLVAAPLFYAYLKKELQAENLV